MVTNLASHDIMLVLGQDLNLVSHWIPPTVPWWGIPHQFSWWGTVPWWGIPLSGKKLPVTFPLNLADNVPAEDPECQSSVVTPVMTYGQLDGLINKWSLEVEDQEKLFLHQATQVNAWDHILIKNGEKITALHREVEKVKLDQKRLGQELYFILSQKKESEDILTPAEESVDKSGPVYLLHADEKQERT
ncbi:Nuclear pore glycoprotein p62 [Heterocephalus glaber]|uniref:Nuclear pore glycoprotein p62 n=1 Tax=Heterocephalus glaber TaxID=10181 RepID=G5BZD8_HETGA|nr:Nuclear pore glycoprotein p62 [Heterocephalus glaber]